MDRNCRDGTTAAVSGRVALRKESVDRNAAWTGVLRDMHHASLSARRAWIEILAYPDMIICTKSLSARRAWIEILMYH